MKRYFYLSDDLDDLEAIQKELEERDITEPQIHVLSEQDSDVEHHQLHEVEAILKKDIVHSTKIGALVGILLAAVILGIVYLMGWYDTAVGWIPFIFLAIVILGFCTWEGSFYGIQAPHYQFKRFRRALQDGKHILLVDVEPEEEKTLKAVVDNHPRLQGAGTGEAAPRWWVRWMNGWNAFIKSMP